MSSNDFDVLIHDQPQVESVLLPDRRWHDVDVGSVIYIQHRGEAEWTEGGRRFLCRNSAVLSVRMRQRT